MISEFYPPTIGGMERHVQTLSKELVRRGHNVAVATLQCEGLPSFEEDEGVHIYRINGWNKLLTPFYQDLEHPFHPPLPDPGVMTGLQRVVALERPEIVHARRWMLYSFVGLKAWSGAKLVVTLHDYSLFCPTMNYLNDGSICTGPNYTKCISCASSQYGRGKAVLLTTGLKLSSILHRYVDKYIAVSSAVREAGINATKLSPETIEVVPSFILNDAEGEANYIDRPSFLPPTDNYILFVGRAAVYKGLNVLFDAYKEINDLAPLVLMITGDIDSHTPIPENVTVVHDVPHAQVMAGWKHCAVGVVPSIWSEPFGQVVVEAMACGKPVVASSVGGMCDIVVDGESGLLVEPGNVSVLRDALRTLLLDPMRREQMGNVARQRAKLFTVGTVTNRIEEIYRELIDEKKALQV
jgi:glycosyltransferase involved in cell wall biosynthesis